MGWKQIGSFVASIWIVAACLMLATQGVHRYAAELWVPSLVCNLITTGLAILVVNGLIEGSERRRQAAAEHEFEMRRLEQVSKLMRNTASGIGLIHVLGVIGGLEKSGEIALEYLISSREQVAEEGRAIMRRSQLYAHMLDADTLARLDLIGSSLEHLASCERLKGNVADFQAGVIFQACEGILDGHRYLVDNYDLPKLREWLNQLQPRAAGLGERLRVGNKYWQEWCTRNGIPGSDGPPMRS